MDLSALSKVSEDPQYTSKIAMYQSQIKVLLHNYQLLQNNGSGLYVPADKVSVYRLKIERNLLKITRRQTRLTKRWMKKKDKSKSEIKEVEVKEEVIEENSQEKSETSSVAEETFKDSQGNAGQKTDLSGMTMKERMAIVRGMRRKGKKKGGPTAAAKAAAAKRAEREASVSSEITDEMIEAAKLDLKPGQFNGDVNLEEMAEIAREIVHPLSSVVRPDPSDKIVNPEEITFGNSESTQFMLNIGLLTPAAVETVNHHHEKWRSQKLHFRNMTYIPEMTDKKHRIKYTYLTPEAGSPPSLRVRQYQTREGSNGNGGIKTAS